MVYVVDENRKNVLFKIDAWDLDCLGQARMFIEHEGLQVVEDFITMNGDMVIVTK